MPASRDSSVDSQSGKSVRGTSRDSKAAPETPAAKRRRESKELSDRVRIDNAKTSKGSSAQSSAKTSRTVSVENSGDATPEVVNQKRPNSSVDAEELRVKLTRAKIDSVKDAIPEIDSDNEAEKNSDSIRKAATLIGGKLPPLPQKQPVVTDTKVEPVEVDKNSKTSLFTAVKAVAASNEIGNRGQASTNIAAQTTGQPSQEDTKLKAPEASNVRSKFADAANKVQLAGTFKGSNYSNKTAIDSVQVNHPAAVESGASSDDEDKSNTTAVRGKLAAAAGKVTTLNRLQTKPPEPSDDEGKTRAAPAAAVRGRLAAAAGNVINSNRLKTQTTESPDDAGRPKTAPAATARGRLAAAAGKVTTVNRLQIKPTEPIKESNSVPVEIQEPLLALENGLPEDGNTRGQPPARTTGTHDIWSSDEDEDPRIPKPNAPTPNGRRSDSSTSTTDTLDPDADGWKFPIPENSGPGTANSSRPGTANSSRPLQPPEGGLGFDKSDNNRPGTANSSRQPSTHRVAMPVRTKRDVSSDFAKRNQTIKKTNQEAHQQVLKTNYDVNFANPDMSDDRYGEVQFQSCCLYVTLNFLVCLLCILGSVAWLNVDVQGVGRDATVRKNLVYSGCIRGAGDCKEMHKTHQCVHAFAAERYPHAETVSVQTPFLAVTMMTKDQTLRNMRNVSAVVVAARGTAYTVHDMSVKNAELQASYAWNPVTANGIISAFHTEAFCPTMQSTGQAEACAAWLARVEPLDKDKRAEWEVFKKDNTGCGEYDTTYTRNADYARSICKSMRTPRMAVTQIQNDMYNLFSAQNEMSLVVCWNATVLVFSFMIILYVLIDHYKQNYTLAATTPTQGYEWPRLSGMFHILATIAAVISLGATLAFTTQRNAANSTMYKDTLLPTGSIMITVISGGISCLLVFVSPLYVEGYVAPDVPSDLEGNTNFGLMHQWRVHTSITFARYGRFLLSRNDLCIAYCNFLTFPILVLLIYVRYNWYSIDVQVQRAFFSAVAVGVLNIIEVSVMGVVFLTTEIDNFNYRRKFLLKYDEGASTPLLRFRLHHSNLVNIASQLVFFLSKMAVFIPTLRQIRHHTKWQYTDDKPEQFQGQNNASQPLVLVTTVFFVMNHVVPLLHNLVVNAGIDTLHYGMFLNKFRTMNAKLVAFTVMNIAVAIVINFQGQ